jgi:hypothetical protein
MLGREPGLKRKHFYVADDLDVFSFSMSQS